MKLIVDKGGSKTYEGSKGLGVITQNFGNLDKADKWSASVSVDGKYRQLARRVNFAKAVAMIESEID
ncbi:MAG: hypothetical protein K5637_01750 [Lachnospiraceae bacterium]|nr:hypothetical protein [Lachnospiraceae bacterium]